MARLSERRYKGLFALVSAIGLVLIVVGYAMAGDRARLGGGRDTVEHNAEVGADVALQRGRGRRRN